MTTPNVLTPAQPLDASVTCGACGHPMDAHDATGLRYCAATARMALVRGCICRGV